MAIKQPIHIGLGNVNNTSDANKPISTATQTALNLKANIASPVFTGTPTAPTPAVTATTTQLATMAAINQAVTGYTSIDVSTAVGGVLTVTDAQSRTQWLTCSGAATSDITFIFPAISKVFYLRLNITGGFNFYVQIESGGTTQVYNGLNILPSNGANFYSPSAISSANIYNNSYYRYDIATNDNSYRLANTALVQAIAALMGKLAANNTWTGQNAYSISPTAPTAPVGTNTTQLATTAFVTAAVSATNIVTPVTLSGTKTITVAQTNVGTGANNTVLTLPLLSGTTLGSMYVIKNFNYTGVTYTANATDKIDGNAPAAITLAPQESVVLQAYSVTTWATL